LQLAVGGVGGVNGVDDEAVSRELVGARGRDLVPVDAVSARREPDLSHFVDHLHSDCLSLRLRS
jgi:hypothetical protein